MEWRLTNLSVECNSLETLFGVSLLGVKGLLLFYFSFKHWCLRKKLVKFSFFYVTTSNELLVRCLGPLNTAVESCYLYVFCSTIRFEMYTFLPQIIMWLCLLLRLVLMMDRIVGRIHVHVIHSCMRWRRLKMMKRVIVVIISSWHHVMMKGLMMMRMMCMGRKRTWKRRFVQPDDSINSRTVRSGSRFGSISKSQSCCINNTVMSDKRHLYLSWLSNPLPSVSNLRDVRNNSQKTFLTPKHCLTFNISQPNLEEGSEVLSSQL